MNKKRLAVFALFLVSLILVASFVLAAPSSVNTNAIPEKIGKVITDVVAGANPILTPLLGESPGGEHLFGKLLLGLILFSIIWIVLSQVDFFQGTTWAIVIVSVAVTILGVRWLTTPALIDTIILPYSALAIAVTAGLPFVIFFLLVNVGFKDPSGSSYKTFRRIAWIFFAVIFVGLWFTRYDDLTAQGSLAGWIYPITVLAAVAMAVIDGTIQRFFKKLHLEKFEAATEQELRDKILRKITEANDDYSSHIISIEERNRRINKLTRELAKIGR
ncbi:MAG: hypothetical protein ABIH72_05175 [archaeon]